MGDLLFSASTPERKEVSLTTSGNIVRKLRPSVIIRDQSLIQKPERKIKKKKQEQKSQN